MAEMTLGERRKLAVQEESSVDTAGPQGTGKEMTLSQRQSLLKTDTPADQLSGFLGMSEARKRELRNQGQIGAWENAGRKIGTLVGDMAGFFALGSAQGQEDLRLAMEGKDNPNPPMEIFASPTMNDYKIMKAAERLQADNDPDNSFNYGGIFPVTLGADIQTDKEQKKRDQEIMIEFMTQLEEERIRGTTIGGEISAGLMQMPQFLLSFMATGGLGTLGRKAVTSTIKQAIKAEAKAGAKAFAAKGIAEVAGVAVQAAIQTAISPHDVARNLVNKRVQGNLVLTDTGFRMLNQNRDKPMTSLVKAFGTTWVSYFSESSGRGLAGATRGAKRGVVALTPAVVRGVVGKGVNAVKGVGPKFIPTSLFNNVKSLYTKYHPTEAAKGTASNIFSKVGFDGFIEELGEEQLGDLMLATFGIENFGAADPESMLDRVSNSIHGWHELAVNAGIIGPLTIGRQTTAQIINQINQRKAKEKFKEPENFELSSEALDDIIVKNKERSEALREGPEVLVEEDELAAALATVDAVKEKAPTAAAPAAEVAKPSPKEGRVTKKKAPVEKKPEAEISRERKLIVEGRVEQLTNDANKQLDRIDALEATRKELLAADRSTKGIDTQIEKADARFDKIDEQIAELQLGRGDVTDIKPGAKIVTTPSKVLGAISARVKEGVKFTKAEIKSSQTEILKAVNRSLLDDADRTKFTKQILGVQNVRQLEKVLPKIQERISKLEDKAARRRLTSNIDKLLKRAKAKKVSGKPVGKFTPEIQNTLDKITEAMKLDAEEAGSRINKNLLALQDPDITPERRIELMLDNGVLDGAADIKNKTKEELEGLNTRLKGLVKDGVDAAKAKLEKQRARREQIKADVKEVLPKVDFTAKQRGKFFSFVKDQMNSAASLGRHLSGWEDLMDVLSIKDTTSKAFKSKLSEHARVIEVEQAVKKDTFEGNQQVVNAGMKAFNLKTDRQFKKRIDLDSQVKDYGTFIDASGVEVRLELSKSEIRKMWMEMQDPLIKENVEVAEGGYLIGEVEVHGFTEEMQGVIFREMTTEDRAFARAQFAIYSKWYDKVNKQYSKDNNVNLPRNEFYSPIRRKLEDKPVLDIFLDEHGYRRSISPGLLKTRVNTFALIQVRSDFEALQSHIAESSHYINWSDKLKDLNAIFGNSRIQDAITNKFGKGTLSLINGFIDDFSNNNFRRKMELEGLFNKLRINFTISALALKPALFFKQQASIFAYAEFIPAKDFATGVVDFWKNPVKNWNTLNEVSPLFLTRADNSQREIRDLSNSKELAAFKKTKSYKDLMLVFTKMGDKSAIAMGGWAVYQHTLKTTGSKAEAVKAFEAATAVTQQSSDVSQLSAWQRGSAFAKLFTMFTSSQNQYLRREMSAIRNVIADPGAFIKGKGRITRTDFAKKIAIYHFILPMFFQAISDFGWDEDEQKRAATLGSLNGIFILGDMIDSLFRLMFMDGPAFSESAGESPVFQIKDDLFKEFRQMKAKDFSSEEVFQSMLDLAEDVVGPLTGFPAKRIMDGLGEGLIQDIIKDDETASGVLKLMGWSPYTVNKKLGPKKKAPGLPAF